MEANFAQRMQISTTWIDTGNLARKPGFLRFSGRLKEQKRLPVFVSAQFRPVRDENRHRLASFEVSCSYNNSRGTSVQLLSPCHCITWICEICLGWRFLDFYKLLQLLRLFILIFPFQFSSLLLVFFFWIYGTWVVFFFFKSLSECAVGAAFSITLLGSFVIFVIPFS